MGSMTNATNKARKKSSKPAGATSKGIVKPKAQAKKQREVAKASGPEAGWPRVSSKMTIAQLKEEAEVRRYVLKDLPKKKADLLYFLVDGSIALKDTREYTAFDAMRKVMESEKATLGTQNERRREEREHAERQRVQKREESQAENRLRRRTEEIKRQAEYHTLSLPSAHGCKLAYASQLSLHGSARGATSRRCDRCYTSMGGYGPSDAHSAARASRCTR